MKIVLFQSLISFQQKRPFAFKSGHSAVNNSHGILFIILSSLGFCRIESIENTKCILICLCIIYITFLVLFHITRKTFLLWL